MVKKKKQNELSGWHYSSNTIFFVSIMLLLLGVFILIISFSIVTMDEFNPIEDVCLDDNKGVVHGPDAVNLIKDGYNCERVEDGPTFYCYKCLDWRQKTKCEINPEAEGCFCDEYFYSDGVEVFYESINKYLNFTKIYSPSNNNKDAMKIINIKEGYHGNIKVDEEIDDNLLFDIQVHFVEYKGVTYDFMFPTSVKLVNLTKGCISAHEPVCKEVCE